MTYMGVSRNREHNRAVKFIASTYMELWGHKPYEAVNPKP